MLAVCKTMSDGYLNLFHPKRHHFKRWYWNCWILWVPL